MIASDELWDPHAIAGLLKTSTRGSDAVVRYGGDEFLVILSNTTKAHASVVVRRIQEYLDSWNRGVSLDGFELSVSVGAAEWEDGKTLDEVLDTADHDMYAIKNAQTMRPGAEQITSRVS